MKLNNKLPSVVISAAVIVFLFNSINSRQAFGQKKDGIVLQGIVYDSFSKKPVLSGIVIILELKTKADITAGGAYRITIPKPGTYTIAAKAEGLKVYKATVVIEDNTIKNIPLDPLTAKSQGITITGKRDLQTVSRHTMTLQQIKDTPATFGDSMNAIAALPGVIRTGGDLFGPIIIRGGDQRGIKYLIDDIPVYSPLHYGGLHSVINSNLIDEIDLYSSAFPAEIGSATSAVISMNTVDDVKRFGGYTDLSILSASALVQTCITNKNGGGISIGSPNDTSVPEKQNAGYILASGRVSYIDIIVLPLVKLITKERFNVVPNYWDYQFKAKYFFNSSNSLTLFCMGSKDYFRLSNNRFVYDGSDPLLTGIRVNTDQMTHGQGLYYTYQPSEKFRNRLTFYSSLRQNSLSASLPFPGVGIAFKNIRVDSKPYVFGFMDKIKAVAVKKYLEIRGSVEYNIYYFTASGNRPGNVSRDFTSDISENTLVPVLLNEKILNHTIGGYVETKFTYEGLTILPGYRSEYLKRTGEVTWDPRCLISYEFPTDTTISVAGGKYSYFFQINPNFFDVSPQYAKIGNNARSEWAIHRVMGLEQVIGLFKLKVEGYWNDFYNLTRSYIHFGPDGQLRQTMNTGKIRAYGAEIMLKKDRREGENGIFGWVSYAYTRSRSRSGLPYYPGIYGIPFNQIGDPWGNRWINYSFEQNHSFKLILGYAYGKHTFTGKFMLYTSNPYTPIVFSQQDTTYYAETGMYRFYPVYGRPNSRHFPLNHRLDLRYSHTTTYSWGYVSWYIEVINVYNHHPIIMERWDYRLPMYPRIPHVGPGNPVKSSFASTLAFIPNFGVEVKF
jgi:hypothetical protein